MNKDKAVILVKEDELKILLYELLDGLANQIMDITECNGWDNEHFRFVVEDARRLCYLGDQYIETFVNNIDDDLIDNAIDNGITACEVSDGTE